MGCNPQESLENTINTMGTLLRVHPIVLWFNILKEIWFPHMVSIRLHIDLPRVHTYQVVLDFQPTSVNARLVVWGPVAWIPSIPFMKGIATWLYP